MTPTPIYQDHTGQWREKNPFPEFNEYCIAQDIEYSKNPKWEQFEQSIIYHQFPNAPDTNEIVEAYLQWQGYHRSSAHWSNITQDVAEKWQREHEPKIIWNVRQVWVLADQQEAKEEQSKDFQGRVLDWLIKCFGIEISKDILERNDRFIEESLELAQSLNYSADRAHALVDYVFNREKGQPFQEVGGVMVTLAALCSATGLDMFMEGEVEYKRINTDEMIEKIRKKQAAKPIGSALPIPSPLAPKVEDSAKQQGGEVSAIYVLSKATTEAIVGKKDALNVPYYNHDEVLEAMEQYATIKTSFLQQENDKLRDEVWELKKVISDLRVGYVNLCEYAILPKRYIETTERLINIATNALNKKP